MRDLTNRLQDFIVDIQSPLRKHTLTVLEDRLFRSLKTQGERAVKGREITKTMFEQKIKSGVSFLMIMEGRHSMSVGGQVVRRFEGVSGVGDIEVAKTNKGACVILRVQEDVDA